jgi:hypothetical protein
MVRREVASARIARAAAWLDSEAKQGIAAVRAFLDATGREAGL